MKAFQLSLAAIIILVACQDKVPLNKPTFSSSGRAPIESVLARAFDEGGLSGSLSYRGQCDKNGEISDSFTLDAPGREAILPVETVRSILARNRSLIVTQDSNGFLRVTTQDLDGAFLRVKLTVSFSGETSPTVALGRILEAPEIREFIRMHNFSLLPMAELSPQLNSASQINGKLEGVPLEGVLDHILTIFPGMWIYRECVTSDGRTNANLWFQSQLPLRRVLVPKPGVSKPREIRGRTGRSPIL